MIQLFPTEIATNHEAAREGVLSHSVVFNCDGNWVPLKKTRKVSRVVSPYQLLFIVSI